MKVYHTPDEPHPRRGGFQTRPECRGMRLLVLLLLFLLPACGLLNDDDPWIYAETPIPENPDGKPLVMTVGDSIAAGWMDCRTTACKGIGFDWWQEAIGDEAIVLSRGIGGSETGDLLQNWSRDTAGADVVIVLSGVNDVARDVVAAQIIANFETMTARAREKGITLVISTIMPSDSTSEAGQAVVDEVNAFLLAQDDWLVIDLHSEMSDPANPGYLRRDEIAHDDSAHPNEAGYARMTDYVRAWWQSHFPEE